MKKATPILWNIKFQNVRYRLLTTAKNYQDVRNYVANVQWCCKTKNGMKSSILSTLSNQVFSLEG